MSWGGWGVGEENRKNQALDFLRPPNLGFLQSFSFPVLFFFFFCSDQLRQNANTNQNFLDVDVRDLIAFDDVLANSLSRQPGELLPMVYFCRLLFFASSQRDTLV